MRDRPAAAGPAGGTAWAETIAAALGLATATRRLSARDAFDLCDPGAVCLVTRGTLNLFVVEPSGRRHGLVQVEAGELAFGLPVHDDGARIVAVPGSGTELAAAELDSLVAASAAVSEVLAPLSHAGSAALLDVLPMRPAPGACRVVHAGERLGPCVAGQALTADELVFVRADEGALAYAGAVEAAAGAFWPLAGGAWLAPPLGATVEIASTAGWLSGPWTADLARFHGLALACFLRGVEADRDEVWRRLDDRRGADTQAFDGSIGALASIGAGATTATAAAPGAPLVGAACLVAEAAGIALALPKGDLSALARSSDPLATLAENGGFHVVPVRLEGDWWRHEMGPLLAYVWPDRTPVALLATKPGRYEAVDPATMGRRRITAANADKFAHDARSFVRLLPSRSVGAREILANGLHGLAGDFRRLAASMLLAGCVAFAMPLIIEQIIGSAGRRPIAASSSFWSA